MQDAELRKLTMAPPVLAAVCWVLIGLLSAVSPVVSFGETLLPDSTAGEEGEFYPDRVRQDVVRMGENIEIAPGDRVEGDVVAIGGTVTVYGKVSGDVVSIGGGIRLKPGSLVEGDAVVVGGRLEQEERAIVLGETVSIGGWPTGMPFLLGLNTGGGPAIRAQYGLKIWKDFLFHAGFFLVGLILFLAFPRRAEVVRSTLRSRFWLSLVAGFGSWIGITVGMILLIITCVGILIAVPAGFLTVLAAVGGGAVLLSLLGELVLRRPVSERRNWILSLLIGLGLFFGVRLIGQLLAMTGGVGGAIGGSLVAISTAAWYVLLLTGLGALVISRLGSPPAEKKPAVASEGEVQPAPTAPAPGPEA